MPDSHGLSFTSFGQPQAAIQSQAASQPQAAGQPQAASQHASHRQQASLREECKEDLPRRKDDASLKLEQLRAPTEIIPCTRAQWAAWLAENIDEMRIRMQPAAAPKRRRDLSTRFYKRQGLPTGVERLQPQADRSNVSTE